MGHTELTRRELLSAAGLTAAGVLLGAPQRHVAADDRPNVLWLTAEDISPDLGCYGDAYARTPNLDRLASEGALFRNAFTHAPVCAPSRSGIITGMYPTTIGTLHMRSQGVPPAYVKCFTEYLRAAGYYCSNNAKTDYNFDSPVAAWDECSATAFWTGRAPGQPFFSVINIGVTHESMIRVPDEVFAERIKDLSEDERHDPARAVLPPYYPDTPVTRRDWARYYDLLTVCDKTVARILKNIEDQGLADNTIVFFFGDHGRGLPRAKRWIYDSGIHVPLIIRWRGKIAPGTVRSDFVRFIDLAPTMLALAGVQVPDYMQGRVFLGDRIGPEPQCVFAARDRMDETYDIIRCARDKQYKYIRNFEPQKPYAQHIAYMDEMPTMKEWRRLNAEGKLEGAQKLFFQETKPVEELYDIVADPYEVNNLAGSSEYEPVLKRMREVLERWMKDTGDLGLIPEAELKERMRPGGTWSVTATPVVQPDGGTFDAPVDVRIECPTDGASIAYTFDRGATPHWLLYSRPIRTEKDVTLRTKACRLGYKDSEEVRKEFKINR